MTDAEADLDWTDLPEHLANPFVAALGTPPDLVTVMEALEARPALDPRERRLPPHLRRYCALRILDWVHPRACQCALVERIGMLIRLGYRHRNPLDGTHRLAILDAVRRTEAGLIEGAYQRVQPTATGMAVLGVPGMGKTLTVDAALRSFPDLVRHEGLPALVTQVPWLKVQCPSTGTGKQFCIAVLEALGARISANLLGMYAARSLAAPQLMLRVQQLAQVHALGLLVVDEIQHVTGSREGPETLMNFLVTLVNTIGVPVLLIGTMAATEVVERDFRSARRAAGLGQPVWSRISQGEEWDDLVTDMWGHQWTNTPTEIDDAIRAALYEHSQGVIDILVKLFLLCQFRAISIGEVAPDGRDPPITADLIASVAQDDLKVVRPMMAALRDGRPELVARFPDLVDFHEHVERVLSASLDVSPTEMRERRARMAMARAQAVIAPDDPMAPIRAVIAARGFKPDVVEATVAELMRRHPSGDPLEMFESLVELVDGRKAGKGAKRPARPRVIRPAAFPAPDAGAMADDPDDLRTIVARARSIGRSVHEALAEVGMAAPIARIVAG